MDIKGTWKRGDTLAFIIQLADGSGNVLSPDPDHLKAQVRTPQGRLLADLSITRATDPDTGEDIAGRYVLRAPESTQDWPAGIHHCDVEVAGEDGSVTSTPTFGLQILEDVTHA